MAVNQVFKGDIVEVSFGKETGLYGQGTDVTSGTGATAGWNTTTTGNSTTISLGAGMYWVGLNAAGNAPHALVPDGMLTGATLRIYSSGNNTRYNADHYPTTKRTYYITQNSGNAITITPALATTAATVANTGDYFIIDANRVPTFEAAMGENDQRVLTDQFIGLLNSFTLPEPEIDVRKQHIVGMGRDVNVLTSGKETLAGGSFDLNAHSLRYWKYALGGHTAKSKGEYSQVTGANTILTALPLNFKTGNIGSQKLGSQIFGTATRENDLTATNGTTITGLSATVGSDVLIGALALSDTGTDITIHAAGKNFNEIFESAEAAGLFKVLHRTTGLPLLGFYTGGAAATKALSGCVDIDTDAVVEAQQADAPIQLLASFTGNITCGDLRVNVGATNAAKFSVGDYIQIYDKDTVVIPGADVTAPTVNKHEIRRVIAIGTANGQDAGQLYVEEAFMFDHTATSCGIERLQYTYSDNEHKRGSPALLSTGELKYGVEHTFFGYSHVPTFAVEQSFRSSDSTPGANQLLRVFSGCKMGDLNLAADSEGELKLSGSFESTRMFKDTASKFITPHRMFENTANTQIKRRVSGIAVNGEKPYLFQHMQFSAFGASVLRAKTVEMSIANTNTAQFYIRGSSQTHLDADQVQQAATQFASEITEAAREYTFKFSALVEDDRWFEQLRTRKHHINSNDCTLTLTKSGAHATRQNATITLEDYTVTKAEHPVPDDKGPVTATVEFAVRHLKVAETSPYFVV
jgi:hypothetical protein